MKKIVLSILMSYSLFANAQLQVPSHKWSKSFGGLDDDIANSIATDKEGNVYTTGVCAGVVDFDPGPAVYNIPAGGVSSDYDIFISKFDSIGNFIWAKRIGSPDIEIAHSLVVDSLKNIYVTGSFRDTVDFDPGPGTYTLQASLPGNGDDDDAFILKLDSVGNFVWVKSVGGFNSTAIGISIKLDGQGNIYNTGTFSGTADFDPGFGSFLMTEQGNADVYILKLNPLGNFVWARSLGGTDGDTPYSITVDKFGSVYTVGTFFGTADLDPTIAGTYTATAAGWPNPDAFISKLDSNGNFVWSKSVGGSYSDYATSVQTDAVGNVYISGYFYGLADFDPGPSTHILNGNDSYVLKLDMNGNFVWVQQIVVLNSNSQCKSSTIDGTGNIYITGEALSGVFVSKLNQNGTLIWQDTYSGGNVFNSRTICLDALGNVFLAGDFNYNASFNNFLPGSVLVCSGIEDIFICKLYQCNRPSAPVNITSSSNLNTCVGSTASLSVSSTYSVNWFTSSWSSTSIGTGTAIVTPTLSAGNVTFYAEAASCATSASRTPITVTVNPNCQYVWPGDANRDGLADNVDVLELGLRYLQTGAPRAFVSNNWQSYFANNWVGTISNGNNLNNSDCNGDGTIDANDTLAIYNNYGLTHVFKTVQSSTVNPVVRIVPDQSSVTKGNWGTASVYLGNFTTNIVDLNGIAFTVDFDHTLIESGNIYIEYINSLIDAGQNLYFRKLDFANGKLYTANTQTISNNVTGSGKIAVLHYQIKSNLSTDEVLNIGLSQAKQSDASGVITALASGTGTLMALGASVGVKESLMSGGMMISPNPTNGIFNISFNTITQNTKIELYNSIGALVLTEQINNKTNTINLSDLSSGIYFMKVLEGNKVVAVKKVVRE